MTLTYLLLARTVKTSLISICTTLFLFSILSLLVFNAYAQQGGAATGGSATSGSTIGGPANCYGTCYFNGGVATGGTANGGDATDNLGSTMVSPPQVTSISPFPYPIDGVTCDDLKFHFTRPFHIHVHLDIFISGQQYTIPSQIGITDKCFYRLHTHDETGIIHIESPENTVYKLGIFLDIWRSQSNINWAIPSKVYVNGEEVSNTSYREIALRPFDEITLVYGTPDAGPTNYNWPQGY